jgi:hypothetical protein
LKVVAAVQCIAKIPIFTFHTVNSVLIEPDKRTVGVGIVSNLVPHRMVETGEMELLEKVEVSTLKSQTYISQVPKFPIVTLDWEEAVMVGPAEAYGQQRLITLQLALVAWVELGKPVKEEQFSPYHVPQVL